MNGKERSTAFIYYEVAFDNTDPAGDAAEFRRHINALPGFQVSLGGGELVPLRPPVLFLF